MLNLENFQAQLYKERTFLAFKTCLLACSGGVDSMVLADLFKNSNLKFAIAHCNFSLRGEESQRDEYFVEEFCRNNHLVFHTQKFDTEFYSKEAKLSIQMAARELRYKWFEELATKFDYDFIVLGHHLDDSIESFFINLSRGTGIRGLCGISENHSKLLRPLLLFSKGEILDYAKKNQIMWHEDVSNTQDKYLRNHIRHHIVPEFKTLKKDIHSTFRRNFEFLSGELNLIKEHICEISEKITLEKSENPFIWKVNLLILKELKHLDTYLYKLFSPFGFKNILDLKKMLLAQTGKQIFSKKFRLIKHKNTWIVNFQRKENSDKIYLISDFENFFNFPISMKFLVSQKADFLSSCQLDLNQIKLPLKLRNYKKEDYFYPLGMKEKKKLSKFFKDEGFDATQKENQWILENGDKRIIWVVNKRIDERFKITSETKNILNIYL